MVKILSPLQKQEFKQQLERRYAALGCRVWNITLFGCRVTPDGAEGASVMVELTRAQLSSFQEDPELSRRISRCEVALWDRCGSPAGFDAWLWHPYTGYHRELTERDHWKLAQQYLKRYHQLAKTVATAPLYVVWDYQAFWQKYRQHLIAREQARRQAEAQAREERTLTVEVGYFDFALAE